MPIGLGSKMLNLFNLLNPKDLFFRLRANKNYLALIKYKFVSVEGIETTSNESTDEGTGVKADDSSAILRSFILILILLEARNEYRPQFY